MTEMCKIKNYVLSLPSCLVPLKRNGPHGKIIRVSISPLLGVNLFDVEFCGILMFGRQLVRLKSALRVVK